MRQVAGTARSVAPCGLLGSPGKRGHAGFGPAARRHGDRTKRHRPSVRFSQGLAGVACHPANASGEGRLSVDKGRIELHSGLPEKAPRAEMDGPLN